MKRAFKVLGIVLGSLLFLLIAAAIVIPLVVDVDKYRPLIVEKANERLNGKLQLGKLKLSLWGQIRVDVAGLELRGPQNHQVVAVKSAYFHVPFASILGGSPVLTLKLENPELNVARDASGEFNVLRLMKPQAQESAPPASSSRSVTLPALVAQSRLGVEFRNSHLNYRDLATGLTTQVRDLNLIVRDLSLDRPTEIAIWADLNTQLPRASGAPLTIRGPARVDATLQPRVSGGKLQQLSADFKVDLDQLEILVPGTFEKKKGVVAHARGTLQSSSSEARIDRFAIRFSNAELSISGTVRNLGLSPVANIKLASNDIDLKPWAEMLPSLREYELQGNVSLKGEAEGPAEKLSYHGSLDLTGFGAKLPRFKARPEINAKLQIATDRIENFSAVMKAPGSELLISGKWVSFSKPRIDLAIRSSGMDLDQLIDFPPREIASKGAAAPKAGGASAHAPSSGQAAEDYDAMLELMRKNELLRATSVALRADLKKLKAYDVVLGELSSEATLKDLVFSVNRFGMKLWKGSFSANGSADFKPAAPTYKFAIQVADLDLQQAMASQMEMFKNTVLGKADFKMEGQGSSFNPEPAKLNLDAKGRMEVKNAVFLTIDVGRMAAEAINKGLDRVAEKVPAVKGKAIKRLPSRESRYQLISSDFSIRGGKFSAPNFVAKSNPKQGIDLKGRTVLGLKDQSIDADWELIDTYNLTQARFPVEVGGVQVEHILAEGDGPVRFPVHVGCTMQSPCYSYTQVPEHLAKVALKNLSESAKGKAKAVVQQKAQEKLKEATKSLPPAVKDKVQGLGKKLFR